MKEMVSLGIERYLISISMSCMQCCHMATKRARRRPPETAPPVVQNDPTPAAYVKKLARFARQLFDMGGGRRVILDHRRRSFGRAAPGSFGSHMATLHA